LALGLHYSGLTDAVWTSDGLTLLVSSSDGYISVISFKEGELGTVYTPKPISSIDNPVNEHVAEPVQVVAGIDSTAMVHIPPTNKKRVTPTLISSTPISPSPRKLMESSTRPPGVLVVDCEREAESKVNVLQPKKKKRVTPTLVSTLNVE
jgi:chromatin assembly factor 1 subunit B